MNCVLIGGKGILLRKRGMLMVKCKKCGQEIMSGEKVVVQFDGMMKYNEKEPMPERFGSLTKYWHAGCKGK